MAQKSFNVKNNLKEIIIDKGLKLEDISIKTGLKKGSISNIVEGVYVAKVETAFNLSRALNKKVNEVFYLEDIQWKKRVDYLLNIKENTMIKGHLIYDDSLRYSYRIFDNIQILKQIRGKINSKKDLLISEDIISKNFWCKTIAELLQVNSRSVYRLLYENKNIKLETLLRLCYIFNVEAEKIYEQ